MGSQRHRQLARRRHEHADGYRPLNFCRGCGQDFASVEAFDRHRVGVHEYTLTEGLRRDPPVEDGRRCLDVAEMVALGWERNEGGRWHDPARTARAREAFSRVGLSAQTRSERSGGLRAAPPPATPEIDHARSRRSAA